MDDARARLASDTAEIRDVVKQRVDERPGRVACAWVHDEAGRLVEHGHVGILVDDFEWERLAGNRRRRRIRDIDGHALPIAHRKVGPGVAALDRDVPVRYELLDEGARASLEDRHQKAVQSLAAEIGRDRKR